ncbi:MAG: DUF2142 domain-containing protein [Lachnospiraceae bacterium]|nr:DUF2142 domain-containing protein [Lachnospiraceae bacterium]
MTEVLDLSIKKIIARVVVVIVIACLLGLVGELFFNYKVMTLQDKDKGNHSVDLSAVYTEGFELINGELVMVDYPAVISLDKDTGYVSKLEYTYTFDKDFLAKVRVVGDKESNDIIEIRDGNNRAFDSSEVVIDEKIKSFEIVFDETALGIRIDGIFFDNQFNFSERRMLSVVIFLIIIGFLLVFNKLLAERIESVFLVVATGVCIAFVFTFPAQKVSWDEATHFRLSYEFGLGNEIVITPELSYYGDDDAVSSFYYPWSEEEFDALDDYLAESKIYDKAHPDNHIIKTSIHGLSDVGHGFSAVGINIGRLLKLPLSALYYMGKLFNGLGYILVTYLAIKKLTVGRRLLTLIALMPTTLFLASTYSYDAMANAFLFLGIATFFAEFTDKENEISMKNYVIFLVSIGIASAVKMVYAPFLLLLLGMPKSKFSSKKKLILMKYGIFILGIIAVAMLVVYMFMNPSIIEDSRGGTTSASGQLGYIFGNLPAYISMLVKSIISTAPSYLIGDGCFGDLAHYSEVFFKGVITVSLLLVALTDTPNIKLGKMMRVIMGITVVVVICFVWTALYIGFTPVGHSAINGVQGRYFIPVVFPLLLIINTDKIKNKCPAKLYNAVVIAVPVLLSYSVIAYKTITYCR